MSSGTKSSRLSQDVAFEGVLQDACAVAEQFAWDIPGVIQVELEPGDMLLHDVMVLHGSERTLGSALRRTIYYEFRASEMIFEEGPWEVDWIRQRLQLLLLALERFETRFPQHPLFQWNASTDLLTEPSSAAQVLKVTHELHSPGAYCSATSAPREVVDRAMARLETPLT